MHWDDTVWLDPALVRAVDTFPRAIAVLKFRNRGRTTAASCSMELVIVSEPFTGHSRGPAISVGANQDVNVGSTHSVRSSQTRRIWSGFGAVTHRCASKVR